MSKVQAQVFFSTMEEMGKEQNSQSREGGPVSQGSVSGIIPAYWGRK